MPGCIEIIIEQKEEGINGLMTRRALPYHLIIHGISIASLIGMGKILHTTMKQRDLFFDALHFEWEVQKRERDIGAGLRLVSRELGIPQIRMVEKSGCNPERR